MFKLREVSISASLRKFSYVCLSYNFRAGFHRPYNIARSNSALRKEERVREREKKEEMHKCAEETCFTCVRYVIAVDGEIVMVKKNKHQGRVESRSRKKI